MWLAGPAQEAVVYQLAMIPSNLTDGLVVVPASIVLGFWFILQLFNGVLSIGGLDIGGVAFWAHIGGFIVGVAMARLLASCRRPESAISW